MFVNGLCVYSTSKRSIISSPLKNVPESTWNDAKENFNWFSTVKNYIFYLFILYLVYKAYKMFYARQDKNYANA